MATPENKLRSRLAAGTIRTQHWSWALAILTVAIFLSIALTASTDSLVLRGAGAFAVIALAGGSLRWFGGKAFAPLQELLDTAQGMAAGDLGSRAPSSDSELGRLGRYFNVLVDRQRVTVGQVEGARQKLEKLLGSLPLEIALFDAKGRYLYEKTSSAASVDTAARLTLGMTPTELYGLRGADLGEAAEIEAAVAQCIETNTAVTVRGGSGDPRAEHEFVRVYTPVDPNPNDAVRVVGYGVDVSEQRQAEAKLRDREEQLRKAQKLESIGRLAGGVAQDFDQILTAMLGSVDLALGVDGLPEAARSDLEEVRGNAQQAKVLTGQLLAFGRKQVLRPEIVDMGHIVREAEMMFRRIVGRHIKVESAHIDHAVPVDIDPAKLEQLLMRLVLNARDAMSDGGRLTIGTDVTHLDQRPDGAAGVFEPGAYAVITVADTGPGMDEPTLARIFEPFFTTNAASAGRGLGLSAVEGTVSQSGGFLTVESVVGVGSTFRLYFPRVGVASEGTLAPQPTVLPTALSDRGTTVVAAGDDLFREFMRRTLERMGFVVLAAVDGGEAIDLARDHEGPLVLFVTDVSIEGVAAPDVARVVSSFRPDLQVLPVATNAGEAMAHQTALGTVLYLPEPFESNDLAEAVEAALLAAAAGGTK